MREVDREQRRLMEERFLARTSAPEGGCRYCHKPVATEFCPHCGARCLGASFETLADCLITREQLRQIHRTVLELERLDTVDGDLAAEDMHGALAAAMEINRRVMQVSDAKRQGDLRELQYPMERGEIEALLEELEPAKIDKLAFNLWCLASDCEQAYKQWEARDEYDSVRKRAREYSWRERWKAAVENWKACLGWLSDNWHPEHAQMKAEAEERLAHAQAALAAEPQPRKR